MFKTVNFQDPKIMKMFTLYGSITFLLVGSLQFIILFMNWDKILILSKVSNFISNLFYFAISLMMFISYINLDKQNNLINPTPIEIEKIIKDIQNGKTSKRKKV